MGSSETVSTSVAAADDDDALAFCVDRAAINVTFLNPIGQGKEIHRLMDANVVTAGDVEIACSGCAAGQDNSIELVTELFAGDVDADIHVAAELNALSLELGETAIEVLLLHLEFGDAVTQETAGTIGAFKDDNVVTGASQLLRGSEARRS
jgi:hypothetical protein